MIIFTASNGLSVFRPLAEAALRAGAAIAMRRTANVSLFMSVFPSAWGPHLGDAPAIMEHGACHRKDRKPGKGKGASTRCSRRHPGAREPACSAECAQLLARNSIVACRVPACVREARSMLLGRAEPM